MASHSETRANEKFIHVPLISASKIIKLLKEIKIIPILIKQEIIDPEYYLMNSI